MTGEEHLRVALRVARTASAAVAAADRNLVVSASTNRPAVFASLEALQASYQAASEAFATSAHAAQHALAGYRAEAEAEDVAEDKAKANAGDKAEATQ